MGKKIVPRTCFYRDLRESTELDVKHLHFLKKEASLFPILCELHIDADFFIFFPKKSPCMPSISTNYNPLVLVFHSHCNCEGV